MGIEMCFEVDNRLTPSMVTEILKVGEFEVDALFEGSMEAYHAESGLNAYVDFGTDPCEVRAEGLVPPTWRRNCTIIFRYCNTSDFTFEACESETMKFARALATKSTAYFVLSHQFEHVYAIRDEKGYREIPDPSSTMASPAG